MANNSSFHARRQRPDDLNDSQSELLGSLFHNFGLLLHRSPFSIYYFELLMLQLVMANSPRPWFRVNNQKSTISFPLSVTDVTTDILIGGCPCWAQDESTRGTTPGRPA